jgi:ACS family pantothenate transporter-like MFS transporter
MNILLMKLRQCMQIFGTAILVGWNVPFGLHVAAYLFASCDGPLSAVYLSWANILTAHDSQVRALTLAFMNAFGNAVTLLVQQFLYQVTTAPKFHKGFSASLGFLVGMVCWAFLVRFCEMRTMKRGSNQAVVFQGLEGEEPPSPLEPEEKGGAVDTSTVKEAY